MNDSRQALPSPLAPDVESRPGLLRVLGLGMAVAMVVGNVIGSGIFLKPGGIAASAGSFPMILTAWILGGCVCVLGALCFAELAVMLPRAGGLYVYLREAYGRPVAFLFGWSEFFFGRPASIGALSVAFVTALAHVLQTNFNALESVGIAMGLIVIMAWVNIVGVLWGGRVQAGTTIIKAVFLGLLAVLPFAMSLGGLAGASAANYATSVVPKEHTLATQFAAVMLAVMWAYNGWHGITPVAEEVRNPRRNIPLALFGGIGLLIVLYVSANLAYHSVLSLQEMAQADQTAPQEMVRKLLNPYGEQMAQWGVALLTAVIMCSLFGAINANLLNGPRVSFAMGRDDVFFRQLGRVHAVYRTPATAIAVQAFMAILLVIASGILVDHLETYKEQSRFYETFKNRSIFDILTNYVIFSASIFYMLAVIAVFVLRRKHPDWERPYRTFGYPLVPCLYLTFYVWFLYRIYDDQPDNAHIGIGLILLGLPVYYAWQWWAARNPEVMHDGQ